MGFRLKTSKTKSWALRTVCLLAALTAPAAWAGQLGLPFPTHRFPTDISFHAAYTFGLGSTSANYLNTGKFAPLANSQKVSWQKNSILLEYQPSNHFSVGGIFSFQRTSLSSPSTTSFSQWTLGDQVVFGEYRFLDGSGYSLGVAGLLKFPGYKNDTPQEAAAKDFTLLTGDAQTDFGGMVTAEFWPAQVVRLQGDFGYLVRSQGFADQLIYQGTIGFVIPRVDLTFRMIGFTSIGSGPTPGSNFDFETKTLREDFFGGSNFAYSSKPNLLMMSPKVEFWIGPEYAVSASLTKTLRGKDAAKGNYFELGFVYRFAERRQKTRRNFTEVDIKTDQNSGVFEGELQEKNQAPTKPEQDYDFEPLYYESAE